MKHLLVGAVLVAAIGTWLVWFSAYIHFDMKKNMLWEACKGEYLGDGVRDCYNKAIIRQGGMR